MEKRNEVLELSFELALKVIEFSEMLEEQRKYVIAKQILRSGTSPGANIREAQNASSRKDFINKCIIALKEADETEYWLLLCKMSKKYPDPGDLLDRVASLKRLLIKIITTSKRNAT
jgi:four helix bundle protein